MIAEALASHTLFSGLGRDELERLAAVFGLERYAAGARIFAAGDRARRLFIVHTGEVVIRFQPYDGGSLDIATIRPGGAFGWSAALKRSYYTSSAYASTDVQALVIDARDLQRSLAADPALGDVLLERLAQLANSRLEGLGEQVMRLLKPKRPAKPDRTDE